MSSSISAQLREASGPPGGQWLAVPLVAGIGVASALLGSWLAHWWNGADEAVFYYFNSRLLGPLTTVWALTNWRPFDVVTALVIAGFVLAWLRAGDDALLERRLAQFVAFCVLLIVAKGAEHLVLGLLDFRRASPSITHEGVVHLSEVTTWITVKDHGATAFPGDHAFVLFSVVGFLWIRAGRPTGITAALTLLPFAVPRIAVGAHWLSDVAVGGLSMAVLLLCAGYATPLGSVLSAAIGRFGERPLADCVRLGRRLRLLR